MPVPLTPPYLQFFDATGAPLAYGTVETYAATTSTKKATYTDVDGATIAPNPIQLNASGIPETGNGMIFIQGAYRIVVKDQYGVVVDDQPNITSFTNTVASSSPFFQSFSGNSSQTSFTLSQNLGTDPNGLMIFVAEPRAGYFQKFSGTGSQTVFTLNTPKGTDSTSLLVFVYNAAAVDKLGYEPQAPSTYTINGTTLTFTVAPVVGTDNIYVCQPTAQNTSGIAGYIDPSLYTVNGTALTFTTAPVSGTNNIKVTAPSTLAGAAAVSAAAADAAATVAVDAATSAQAFAISNIKWTFSNSTSIADPGSGNIRFNNASFASVGQLAISETNASSVLMDAIIATWDDSTHNPRTILRIFKDATNFVIFGVTGNNIDNGTWDTITVSYIAGNGSFTNGDTLYIGYALCGNDGLGTGDMVLSAVQTVTGAKTYQTAKLLMQLGSGSGTAKPVGYIAQDYSTRGNNSGGAETDLDTFTLVSNSFAVNKVIRVSTGGVTANNGNAKTIKIYYGSTVIFSRSMTTSAANTWAIELEIAGIGTNSQRIFVTKIVDGTPQALPAPSTASETDSNANVIKVTGTASGASDIVQSRWLVESVN